MSTPGAWLPWSICALALVLTEASLLLLLLSLSHPGVDTFDYWVEDVVLAAIYSTVGAVIASRHPENPTGWILCAIGFIAGVDHFCAQYATYTLLAEPGSLPGGGPLSWVRAWIWVPHIGLFVFLGLFFPDGRLPSNRWRPVALLSAIMILIAAALMAFSPGPIDGFEAIYNPLGAESFGIVGARSIDILIDALMFLLTLVVSASLFVRLRRAREVERQQIKWLAYAATVAGGSGLIYYTISELTGTSAISWVSFVFLIVGLIGIPIAAGIAITRYRLQDIDVIIRQTLIYGSVISILVALFEFTVVVLSGLFSEFAEHYHLTESYWLTKVISALAVAALFDPLRDRIQRFVENSRPAAWLAWSMCVSSLGLTVLSIGFLVFLILFHPRVPIYDYWVHATVIAVAFSTVGAIIASRRPRHPVGWLFCAIGLFVGVDHFCGEYATYGLLVQPDFLPASEAAAWIRSWIWIVSGGLGVFLVLLFPDGCWAGHRWRYVAWLNAGVIVLGSITVAFSSGPVDGLSPIRNPLGIDSLGDALRGRAVDLVEGFLAAVALAAAISLFVRLRRVNNVERQQIKWFAYAATILITGDLLSSLVAEVWGARWVSGAGFVLYIAGLAGLPVAVGIAILRYHLYDIDFIISRTLVYVSLGAVLASLFEFNVVVLSGLFSEFAEHYHLTESHWLAEVISALGIAVVFDPLRDRIQRFVDRRLFGEAGGKTPAQSKETNSA